MKSSLLVLLLACLSACAQGDPVDQVNPFVGTQTSQLKDNGNTVPGATRPFGMLSWSPDPPDGMYRYENPVTRGFSLTHLSGPGCGAFGDVPVFPMLGTPAQSPVVSPLSYHAAYRPEDQVAGPGYYAVKLDSGIQVRLAAAVHSGLAEVEFPAGADLHTILLDLSRNLNVTHDADVHMEGSHISGAVHGGGFCGLHNRYTVYFSMHTEEKPQVAATFDEHGLQPQSAAANGPRVGGYLQFASNVRTVHLKVGLSFVSVENAEKNLEAEIPDWSLQRVRDEARRAWNDALGHAMVSGGSESQRTVFYTAMYHVLLQPTAFSDVSGDYMGFDGKAHNDSGHVHYANLSGWDIYRGQVQLVTMLFPKIGSDIAQSIVLDAEQGGGLPIWPLANDESGCMVGDPSDLIVAGIYAFGGHGFDTASALRSMVRGANEPTAHTRLYTERPGLAEYLKNGYIAESPLLNGSASVTLEDENADFAIAQFARELGDKAMADKYLQRSAQWQTLFDSETHYIRPRTPDGKFLANFKPENYDGFVEGNSAQYTWMIPYDLSGVVRAVGGNDVVNRRLDDYFSQYGSYVLNHGPYFYIANEPSFGNPWIYNWSGEPWRAQAVVRKTLADLFNPKPDGLPGNDDLGATSAWIVFAQLGFFPEIPPVGGFTVNSPTFPEATLVLGDHKVQIHAPGAPKQQFIRTLHVDGKAVRNWWIPWADFKRATSISYALSDNEQKSPGELPPSFPAQLSYSQKSSGR